MQRWLTPYFDNMAEKDPILIADSGSTKTDWCLLAGGKTATLRTVGINPFMLSADEIAGLLRAELMPWLSSLRGYAPRSVCFYGAGCRDEGIGVIRTALSEVLGIGAEHCEAHSDMLGAARAVCGNEPGVACILGTGSNSCLYDGHAICHNVSPLGYILGDEGSGAVLGKRLLGDLLKGQLSEDICAAFRREYPEATPAKIIRSVYCEPAANRYLASFAPFLGKHKDNVEIQEFIFDEFERFFKRNVAQYRRPELPVNFVGSVAFFLRVELQSVAASLGYRIGRILRTPLEGLVAYHSL